MLPISKFFIAFLSLFSLSQALSLSPYNHLAHPLYTLNETLRPKYSSAVPVPTPVVLHKYYLNPNTDFQSTRGALFLPRSGNYETFSSTLYFSSADVLYISRGKPASKFLELHLNHAARVSLLLTGPGINRRLLTGPLAVRGPSGWKTTSAVRSSPGAPPIVGDPDRHGEIKLPSQGVLIERLFEAGMSRLPHPSFFKVNQKPASRFVIFFSHVSSLEEPPISFPYPEVPQKITLPITGKRIEAESVTPNKACPSWLHDIHVTESREDPDVTESLKDLPYWRTWHPHIDPIYWCYYGHEHGAYPGPHKPMLGYTAWKTFDPNGYMQRQDESHEGFKVFAFPVRHNESDDAQKFVVIVVHMHLAFARRFTTRFHTVSIAVWGGDDDGRLEAEFHMKMDFGAANVPLANRGNHPIDASQEGIHAELRRRRRSAGRRFNVLNVDANYPESVDKRFGFNAGAIPNKMNKEKILRGVYEQWEGPLNTCSESKATVNRGFKFDVRNPSTAIRFLNDTTDQNIQHLSGNSINRFMVIRSDITVAMNYCWFDVFSSDAGVNLELSDGVFYTDPFFRSVLKGPGKYSVRQYIVPEWAGVQFPKGKIQIADIWNGWMIYTQKGRTPRNIEGAIDKFVN